MTKRPGLNIPYWRLSGYYFIYFAALGTFLPYWSPYLRSIGYDAVQIGQCFAVLTGSKIFAPYLWGWIADYSKKRTLIIRMATFMALLCFSAVIFTQSFSSMLWIMLVYGFFWSAMLPQFEVITLNHLDEYHHRYSNIRLWGSVGFIITVVIVGAVLDKFGYRELPYIYIFMVLCILAISFSVTEKSYTVETKNTNVSVIKIVFQPRVIILFVVCFLMQLSHAPYYTFFSIYLENLSYAKSAIGFYWGLGVLSEIFIFLIMYRLIPKIGSYWLLLASLLIAFFRWLLIAFWADHAVILFFTQLLHAFTFGMFHAVMINLIHEYFKGAFHGRGQSLYSSISFGAGTAAGSFLSGYLWNTQGASDTYVVAAMIALLALGIAVMGLRDIQQPNKLVHAITTND